MKKISLTVFSLILTLAMANVALACSCGCKGGSCGEAQFSKAENQDTEGKVQCPVMKNWFVADENTTKVEHEGKTYYFCCPGCKTTFLENPEKYLLEKDVS